MSEKLSTTKAILLAEDEYFIADVLSEAMEMENWRVIGPFSTVASAMRALTEGQVADVAVLDVNLNGELVFPLVDRLLSEDTPVILTTGYDVDDLPPQYLELPRFQKPMGMRQLIDCVNKLLAV